MKKEWYWIFFYGLIVGVSVLLVKIGGYVVTVMSENKPIEREHCIIIDPGHGGEDGGAVSYSNLPESGYNLEIAIRLQKLLQLMGYETKLIRTDDVSIYTRGETLAQKKISDLRERVRIANETKGAVLLSIHQNHYSDPQFHGAQVFYAGTEGSKSLAKLLQGLFVASINPGSRRQIKKSSGVYLMDHIVCPGVLIECGFLSNPEEEQKLRDPIYQKKIGMVIAAGVGQYLSNT